MKILVIIKSSAVATPIHKIAVKTVKELYSQKAVELLGIFFTDVAAAVGASGINQISDLEDVQNSYLNFSKNHSVPLFVCGRAYMETGLDKANLKKGFELSGNLELSMLISSADKILEF